MTAAAICPYCRGPIEDSDAQRIVCSGCGTPHHTDCYEENGGCTVFGCSSAPVEEAKLSVSPAELNAGRIATVTGVAPPPAPPPPPGLAMEPPPYPRLDSGNVLFVPTPIPQAVSAAAFQGTDSPPDAKLKSRTTFILLGVLFGALGGHNFYAGYRDKALTQLLITLLTLGFAGPMIWIWAVIDVCTVKGDRKGVKFKD